MDQALDAATTFHISVLCYEIQFFIPHLMSHMGTQLIGRMYQHVHAGQSGVGFVTIVRESNS